MKVQFFIFYLVLLLTLDSCGRKYQLKKSLCAIWTVETMIVDSTDITYCVNPSTLSLYYDNLATLPTSINRCDGVNAASPQGQWKLNYEGNQVFLSIESKNPLFKIGTYKVTVGDRKSQLEPMYFEAFSGGFYLKCTMLWPLGENIPKNRSMEWM